MKPAVLALLVLTTLGLGSCDAPPTDGAPDSPDHESLYHESLYRGRPVSHWLLQIRDLHWPHRDEAVLALIEFGGPDVAARLISLLALDRPEIVKDVFGALEGLGEREVFEEVLRNENARVRAWAAILLADHVTEWFGSYPTIFTPRPAARRQRPARYDSRRCEPSRAGLALSLLTVPMSTVPAFHASCSGLMRPELTH